MVVIPNIGLFDLGLGLIYLFLIYFFAFRYQQKKILINPEYRYFLFGLSTKIVGSIAFVLISLYYYQKRRYLSLFSDSRRFKGKFICRF